MSDKLKSLSKAATVYGERVAPLWSPNFPAPVDLLTAIADLRADLAREIRAEMESDREMAEARYDVMLAAFELAHWQLDALLAKHESGLDLLHAQLDKLLARRKGK